MDGQISDAFKEAAKHVTAFTESVKDATQQIRSFISVFNSFNRTGIAAQRSPYDI